MSNAPGTPLPFEVPPPSSTTSDKRRSGLRLDGSLIALGVGLLATAVVISTVYSRQDGDLDWSNYGVGLAAAAALLIGGLIGRTAVKDRDVGRHLVSWPLAFGAVAAGLMVSVALDGLDDFEHTSYVVGGVIAGLGVLGYLLAPSAPPALAAVLGLVLVYGEGVSDVVTFDAAEENVVITGAIVITVFVLAVTLLSTPLRPARVVVGVTAGFGAVLGFIGLIAGAGFVGAFGAGFSDMGLGGEGSGPSQADFENDIYVVLALAALLVLVWMWAAHLSDSAGYRVLVVAMTATIVPTAMAALVVEHPSWWGAAVGVVGALVLGLAGLRSLRAGRDTTPGPGAPYSPTTPPGGTPAYGSPPSTPAYGTPATSSGPAAPSSPSAPSSGSSAPPPPGYLGS